MKVPFLDLNAHHAPIRQEIQEAIQEVIDRSAFAGGPFVTKFEEDFATFCQSRFAIGVGHGTEAIWLVLLALGIGEGDEVITVPSTFMATAEAISFCGAKPVFVDIDEQTYTLNPALLKAALTPRTKAIIPVHLFGQSADMDPIMAFAKEHGLHVIEDACQAHGAEYKGRKVGSIGDAGCFSFYPGKNLGAFGEAGAITTNNSSISEKVRILRDHGQEKKYYHSHIGWNARMDGIQGAVLRVKLKYLAKANAGRQAHAKLYAETLDGGNELIIPHKADYGTHVYHIYGVRTKHRDNFLCALEAKQIFCAIHYPIPVHLQKAYSGLGLGRGTFPVAERCADEFLSLPMYPELSPEQIRTVANAVNECVRQTEKGGVLK